MDYTVFNALGKGQYWLRCEIMHMPSAHTLSRNLNCYWPHPHALNRVIPHKCDLTITYYQQ